MARPSGDSARDRLNLFLAIVPFVLLRESVTVDEVAKHFGVKRERVIQAVQTIACDGGANEARYNFDTELFNIDWEEFDENEVIILTVAELLQVPAPFSARQRAVFLAGLELLKVHPHYRRLSDLDGLIDKLRGSTGSAITDVFAVAVDASSPVSHAIEDAIEANRRIHFTYTNNKGERSERDVDPYRQYLEGGQRYVKGYCYLRNAVITFNLDSIEDLEILDTAIEPRSIDPLDLTSAMFTESESDVDVEISIDPEALPLIAAYRRPGSRPVERGGRSTLTIPFSYAETAVRMISVLPGVATITEPSDVRARVADFATAALDAYRAEA